MAVLGKVSEKDEDEEDGVDCVDEVADRGEELLLIVIPLLFVVSFKLLLNILKYKRKPKNEYFVEPNSQKLKIKKK